MREGRKRAERNYREPQKDTSVQIIKLYQKSRKGWRNRVEQKRRAKHRDKSKDDQESS